MNLIQQAKQAYQNLKASLPIRKADLSLSLLKAVAPKASFPDDRKSVPPMMSSPTMRTKLTNRGMQTLQPYGTKYGSAQLPIMINPPIRATSNSMLKNKALGQESFFTDAFKDYLNRHVPIIVSNETGGSPGGAVFDYPFRGETVPLDVAQTQFPNVSYLPFVNINPGQAIREYNTQPTQVLRHEFLHQAQPITSALEQAYQAYKDLYLNPMANPLLYGIGLQYGARDFEGQPVLPPSDELYAIAGEMLGPSALNDPTIGKAYQGIFQPTRLSPFVSAGRGDILKGSTPKYIRRPVLKSVKTRERRK